MGPLNYTRSSTSEEPFRDAGPAGPAYCTIGRVTAGRQTVPTLAPPPPASLVGGDPQRPGDKQYGVQKPLACRQEVVAVKARRPGSPFRIYGEDVREDGPHETCSPIDTRAVSAPRQKGLQVVQTTRSPAAPKRAQGHPPVKCGTRQQNESRADVKDKITI